MPSGLPQSIRDDEGWQYSAANLNQIGLALHSYHEVYGRLPPAVKLGKDGALLYTWRVLLLPFLEQQYRFCQFNFDEPWDGPHNKPLLENISKYYMLPMGGLFQKPIHLWCYEIGRSDGFNACFADGNVRFIRSDIDERVLRGFITQSCEATRTTVGVFRCPIPLVAWMGGRRIFLSRSLVMGNGLMRTLPAIGLSGSSKPSPAPQILESR